MLRLLYYIITCVKAVVEPRRQPSFDARVCDLYDPQIAIKKKVGKKQTRNATILRRPVVALAIDANPSVTNTMILSQQP